MYVLMITPNKFPNGDAGAVRDEQFSKIYQELGYNVIHIGMGTEKKQGIYKNINYYSLYKDNSGIKNKIISLFTYKLQLENIFKKVVQKNGLPKIIHIYDIPFSGIEWARRIAIKKHIQIIHDSVEWYSPCEFRFGRLSHPYILKTLTNRVLIRKPIKVIAISSFLEKHFKEKGLQTIRIPVIMDSNEYKPRERFKESKIKIVYAGSPAKKDYLSECLLAFKKLPHSIRDKFEFSVLGADDLFVKKCLDNDVPNEIIAYGRIPRSEVVDYLADADFSILIRPENERYTKAGFPTKSVEAMMNGCGMICNLTSDLEMYLKNGENSIIVEDSTVGAIKKALYYIANMSHEQIKTIRESSRKTAEKCFDYRLYVEKMKCFISQKER